jgi:hypothetical protein
MPENPTEEMRLRGENAALRARVAELESALLDVRAKAKESNRSDTLHGRDLVFSMPSQQGAYVARLRASLGEIESLAAAAGSVGEREADYDYETHRWTRKCPYGDVCSGCDARGYCTRMEPGERETNDG